jgi:hypothetical protein
VDDDARSRQENAEDAEARCILDLTLHLPTGTTPSRLAGIGRFYEHVLGCEVASLDDQTCIIATGGPRRADGSPLQTLTYKVCDRADVRHDDLDVDDEGRALNRGAHISIYLNDLRGAYRRADELGTGTQIDRPS